MASKLYSSKLKRQIRKSSCVIEKWQRELDYYHNLPHKTRANWDRIADLIDLIKRKQQRVDELKGMLAAVAAQHRAIRHIAPRRQPRFPLAYQKLEELCKELGNDIYSLTLEGIASRIGGVSRERVRQLWPKFAAERRAYLASARAFAAMDADLENMAKIEQLVYCDKPAALLPKSRSGMTRGQIAKELGIALNDLDRLWKILGLPDKNWVMQVIKETGDPNELARWRYANYPGWKERAGRANLRWQAANRDKVNKINARAAKKWLDKVISVKTCDFCGNDFLWRNKDKDSYRARQKYTQYVCKSKECVKAFRSLIWRDYWTPKP